MSSCQFPAGIWVLAVDSGARVWRGAGIVGCVYRCADAELLGVYRCADAESGMSEERNIDAEKFVKVGQKVSARDRERGRGEDRERERGCEERECACEWREGGCGGEWQQRRLPEREESRGRWEESRGRRASLRGLRRGGGRRLEEGRSRGQRREQPASRARERERERTQRQRRVWTQKRGEQKRCLQ
eukprot:1831478-Rhodomonas_salina.3